MFESTVVVTKGNELLGFQGKTGEKGGFAIETLAYLITLLFDRENKEKRIGV